MAGETEAERMARLGKVRAAVEREAERKRAKAEREKAKAEREKAERKRAKAVHEKKAEAENEARYWAWREGVAERREAKAESEAAKAERERVREAWEALRRTAREMVEAGQLVGGQ